MKRAKTPLVALVLLVAAACTSTENPLTGASSTGGESPSPSIDPSGLGGDIVFNRGTWPGIAVYSLDLGTGTEHKIRDVEDFVTMSPDGTRFVDIAWKADGITTPAMFDIDGSGYTVLKFAGPTFGMAVGSGGWSPDGKRFFGGGGDPTDPSRDGLYTVRVADGGGLVRLTESSHDYAVGYSPDGSHALFIREKKPYDHSGPMNVFAVNTDGSNLTRLNPPGTRSWLDGQSWSPDGRQVAFVASRDGHDGNAVFVVNADGTNAKRITPWGVTLRADWSPDGVWIALDMSAAEEIPRDLFLVHPDGTELTQITSNEDNKMSFAPAWSPDSQNLLFVRREYSAEGTDLWTVNVDGTGLTQVTDLPAEYTGYRWLSRPSPSNGDITFVGDDVVDFSDDLSDNGIVYVVDPAGGEPRKLLDTCPPHPGGTRSCERLGITSVDWSPDGTHITYSLWGHNARRNGIYVMEIGTERVHRLSSCTDPCLDQRGVDWSPDGSRIAYAQADMSGCDLDDSTYGGCNALYSMKSDGTERVKLATGSVSEPMSPSWSPDGTSIAFSGRVGEDWFVYTTDLDGSEPTQLAADLPSPRETRPAWSPDGSSIAFITWEGAAPGAKPTQLDGEHGLPFKLWWMAPDGSDRRFLADGCCLIGGAGFSVQAPVWSPNGTQILLGGGTGGSLEVIDARTAESSDISWGKRAGPGALSGPIAWQPLP
jgi:Tol biopolymer transport system component